MIEDFFIGQRVIADTIAKQPGTVTGFWTAPDGWELVVVRFDSPIGVGSVYQTQIGRYHPAAVWPC